MAAEVLVKPTYRNRLAVVPVRSVLGFGGVQPALCACASAEGDDDLEQDVTASVLDPAPPETSHEAVMFQRRLGAGWVGRGKEADVLEHVEIALDRHESLRVLDVIGGRRRRKHRVQSRRRGGRCDGGRRGRQQGRDTPSEHDAEHVRPDSQPVGGGPGSVAGGTGRQLRPSHHVTPSKERCAVGGTSRDESRQVWPSHQ